MPKLPTDKGYMGDPRRGASLGRPDRPSLGAGAVVSKFYLQRVRINSGGYDSGGAYWGIGSPLYWASCPDYPFGRHTHCYTRGHTWPLGHWLTEEFRRQR